MILPTLIALLSLTVTDPTGDTAGDGTLTPPTAPIYANTSPFDLHGVSVQVGEDGSVYVEVALGSLSASAPGRADAGDEDGTAGERGEQDDAPDSADSRAGSDDGDDGGDGGDNNDGGSGHGDQDGELTTTIALTADEAADGDPDARGAQDALDASSPVTLPVNDAPTPLTATRRDEMEPLDLSGLVTIVDIYIDDGTGGATQTLSGPDLLLPQGRGWRHALRISPAGAWELTYLEDEAGSEEDPVAGTGTGLPVAIGLDGEEPQADVDGSGESATEGSEAELADQGGAATEADDHDVDDPAADDPDADSPRTDELAGGDPAAALVTGAGGGAGDPHLIIKDVTVMRAGNVMGVLPSWTLQPDTRLVVYAMTGVHDPFSPTGWRLLSELPSPWAFSSTEQTSPVVDLLAADSETQRAALRSGVLPMPAAPAGMTIPLSPWLWLMVAGVAVALLGLVLRSTVKPPQKLVAAAGEPPAEEEEKEEASTPTAVPATGAPDEGTAEPVLDTTPEVTGADVEEVAALEEPEQYGGGGNREEQEAREEEEEEEEPGTLHEPAAGTSSSVGADDAPGNSADDAPDDASHGTPHDTPHGDGAPDDAAREVTKPPVRSEPPLVIGRAGRVTGRARGPKAPEAPSSETGAKRGERDAKPSPFDDSFLEVGDAAGVEEEFGAGIWQKRKAPAPDGRNDRPSSKGPKD